jgi:hypothetical protein
MDDKPPENSQHPPDRQWLWSAFLWAVIGFGGGTVIVSQFVLSMTVRDRTLGCMLFGGVPFGLAGWLYGAKKADP